MHRCKVIVYGVLERFFKRVEHAAESARYHFSICADCGRNRYTGAPCVGDIRNHK